MNQCEETEEGVHPSETPLCGQHDNQTKAQSRLDSGISSLSDSKKDVATGDGDSVWSSGSRISLGSEAFSESSCVSRKRKPYDCSTTLKKKKKENTSPPTTQELGVGSSAWMETMSTYPPTAVPTSLPTTICRPHPLPPSLYMKWIHAMNQCEETEEGVHPSETPLCGQHDNQTKAQRSVKQQKPDSLVVSGQKCRVKSSDPHRLNFGKSPFSHPLKKVATADRYSVLSSYSWEKVKTAPPPPKSLLLEVVLR